MKLFIVRHGETYGNVMDFMQGQKQNDASNLNENGINQIRKLSERFKDEKIDFVYSSNLKRAVDTAKEILKNHPGIKLKEDIRITERFWGEYEGKKRPKNINWDYPGSSVETKIDLQNRVKDFLKDIYNLHKNDVVVIVTHGGTKRAFMKVFSNLSPDEWIDFKSSNTAVSLFEINKNNKYTTYYTNSVKHLD